MTKGLTRLASHNSNMVALHKQNYEGGWTIYRTKKNLEQENLQKETHNHFLTVIQITQAIIAESICSEITQEPFLLQSTSNLVINHSTNQDSEPI